MSPILPDLLFKKKKKGALSFPTGFIVTETHGSHHLSAWRSVCREGLSGARRVPPLTHPTPQSRSSAAPWQVAEVNITGISHGDTMSLVRRHKNGSLRLVPTPHNPSHCERNTRQITIEGEPIKCMPRAPQHCQGHQNQQETSEEESQLRGA